MNEQDYPPISDEDARWLSDNPNTNDILDWVRAYVAADRALREQAKPVAWMHSKTGKLANSPYDISLADGDETAIPLYETPPLSEAEIQDLRDRAVGMLDKSFPAPQAQPERKPMTSDEVFAAWTTTAKAASQISFMAGARAAEAFHGIKEKT